MINEIYLEHFCQIEIANYERLLEKFGKTKRKNKLEAYIKAYKSILEIIEVERDYQTLTSGAPN